MKSLEYLSQLVSFPSVSSSSNVDISRHVEQLMRNLGLQTEWVEYEDKAGVRKACVSAKCGSGDSRGLAYFCHTDVVPVDSWSFESSPWELTQKDGRAYGRGSCDMKGSLACMLAAVEEIGVDRISEPLFICCTADEEVGFGGAKEIVRQSEYYRSIVDRQSRAIIGEPTELTVVHAHKGGCGIKVTSRGVAAHSSTNEGKNANFAMLPFLADMHEMILEVDNDSRWMDNRFDPPSISLNLGINDYTYAVNITPPQSVCTIYFRTMPETDAEYLLNRITESATKNGLEFEVLFSGHPVFTDPGRDFIKELLQLTDTDESRTVSYGTDGACFTELKDIAVFGPGSIAQAHKDDEWITLDQLERGESSYRKLIENWCVS